MITVACRSMVWLAVCVTVCQAFSSSKKCLYCRRLSGDIQRPRVSSLAHTIRRCCGNNVDDDSFPTPEWSSRSLSSIYATTALSVIFAGVSIFGYTEAATALDGQFIVLQNRQEASAPQSSIEAAFQSFLRKETVKPKLGALTLIQRPTLLTSNQSQSPKNIVPGVAKDNSQPSQQIIAKPTTSDNPGPSSVKPIIQSNPTPSSKPAVQVPTKGELQASAVEKIAKENKIEVELICKDNQRPLDSAPPIVKIDRETFQKVKIYQPPFLRYLPSSVQPLVSRQFQSFQVLKSIPDNQLFIASVFAGSITEMLRTLILYPLSTVKARVQARTSRSTNRKRPLLRKLRVTWLTFLYETKRGDWYAGILPSLLITVPASGVYSGLKEVSRRAFSMVIQVQVFQNLFPGDDATSSYYSALVVSLLAAFVADIAALAIRTPADVLALRLQVFGDNNVRSEYSDWVKDSWALLPAMIITDIPFLLSRIFLNAAITTSGENLGQYEVETIIIACLCAFLTTPFDVARTRILLPTLPSEEDANENDTLRRRRLVAPSKYREQRRQKVSVLITLKRIAAEGNGGVENLYAGWLERTAYLGIGRAWLDPLRVIGYLGIRDALLLKLFD